MATLYRNVKTGRLVKLYRVSPRCYTGSWLEQEDFFTKETKTVRMSDLILVATLS